jgi:hypothetical protein
MLVRSAALGLCLALAAPCARAAAQTDTTVVAGREYQGSALREGLLGDDYRDLWTSPVRVEVLDLDRFAGGLTPTERGGGKQTRSLRLVDARGQEYAFRSVNKYPSLAAVPALEGTIVASVVRDQVSSLHPAAALVAAPLLDAAGVLHVSPRLVVMPDDPRLGEFREEFAGMLGTLELRPNELEDGEPGFGGFTRIIGTERLLERLEEDPEQRVDAREYAKARLMDLLLGDWDRHADQWRWAGQERGGTLFWLPIPRDRDYAFVDYDGILPGLAAQFIPNAVSFGPRIGNVYGLTLNARELDRRLLAEVDRAAWDSIASHLQSRLTDAVIEDAVSRMPPEYAGRSAERIAAYLKSRRAELDDAARRLDELLSTEVDVHASDEAELALIERVGEEVVEVRLFRRRGDSATPEGEPFFRRRFLGSQTNEVRVFLHGGDDLALVRGQVDRSLMVRVVGGGGDDVLVDSSVVRGEDDETAFYDGRGDNRFVTSSETVVSEEEYEFPETPRTLGGETFRDWGFRRGWTFAIDYQNPDGLILGAGPVVTRYGFRKFPYSHRLAGRVLVAPETRNVAVDFRGDFRRVGAPHAYRFLFSASQLEVLRFYGFGNDTEERAAPSRYAIQQDQVVAQALAAFRLPAGGELSVGPEVKYSNPDLPDDHPVGVLPRYGRGGFAQVGAVAEALLDRRDQVVFPRGGALLRAGASAYPGLWDADGAFGGAHAEARVYLPVPSPTETTLAVRAGGRRVWGEFPVHEAAFLGGSSTLRGYPSQRFAGDAVLFGNAELRALLFPVELIVNGDLGALALADAGRVRFDGASPGGWHTAFGGGLWFRFDIRGSLTALSLTYARGEDRGRFYFEFGVPF